MKKVYSAKSAAFAQQNRQTTYMGALCTRYKFAQSANLAVLQDKSNAVDKANAKRFPFITAVYYSLRIRQS